MKQDAAIPAATDAPTSLGDTISTAAIRATLPLVGAGLKLAALDYGTLRWVLETTPPAVTDRLSRERAREAARHAARKVPAYRDFLLDQGVDVDHIDRVDAL